MFIQLRREEETFSPARLAEIVATAMFFLAKELGENFNGHQPWFDPNGMMISRDKDGIISVTVSGWDTAVQMVVQLEQSEEGTVPTPSRILVKQSSVDKFPVLFHDSEFRYTASNQVTEL